MVSNNRRSSIIDGDRPLCEDNRTGRCAFPHPSRIEMLRFLEKHSKPSKKPENPTHPIASGIDGEGDKDSEGEYSPSEKYSRVEY